MTGLAYQRAPWPVIGASHSWGRRHWHGTWQQAAEETCGEAAALRAKQVHLLTRTRHFLLGCDAVLRHPRPQRAP